MTALLGGVELHGVRHAFDSDVRLTYPDARFDEGEHAVIVGPSGSGKTTLLHFVAGLLTPSEGLVRVGELAVSALNEGERDHFRSRSIGYVFQDFHLMPGYTALENVLLGLGLAGVRGAEAGSRARETLAALGLGKRLRHTPRTLSTGERQRVALARAIAHRPKLLLADEPTAHLDRSRAGEAVELLRGTARDLGATLLVVSHDPFVTERFERQVQVGETVQQEVGRREVEVGT